MDFRGYLLLSDIDGTLYTKPPNRFIPPRNYTALKAFMESGGRFAVATGRSIRSAQAVIGDLPMNCPAILLNGGCLYDFRSGSALWECFLPWESRAFIEEVHRFDPQIGIEVHVGIDLYCLYYSKESEHHVLAERDQFSLHHLDEIPQEGWSKILFASSPERIDRLQSYLQARENASYYFVRSEATYYELLPTEATKGNALRRLSKLLDIPLDKTFAIGDYYNDIELLKAAGYSAAVGNAPPAVQKSAGYIACPCAEGAVADFIFHLNDRVVNGGIGR